MKDIKVAVIAGTPVDTQMGVDFLKSKDIDAYSYPVSKNPKEQTVFQTMDITKRKTELIKLIKKIKKDNMDSIMVYCNSLSSSIDFGELSELENIFIVTPLDVYKTLAKDYTYIAVIAANNQATGGIEKTIVNENGECIVVGTGILSLVMDIESKKEAKEILENNCIQPLLKFYEGINVEALILGCTHFSYFRETIKDMTTLKIIDPAEQMYEMLISKTNY